MADKVSFLGDHSGTLALDASADFGGSVSGFSSTDALDLFDIGFGAGGTRGYSGNGDNSGGTLSMSDGTNTANIALISNYTASATAAR